MNGYTSWGLGGGGGCNTTLSVSFLAHLYKCSGRVIALAPASVFGGGVFISEIFRFYVKVLCDGQGAVR